MVKDLPLKMMTTYGPMVDPAQLLLLDPFFEYDFSKEQRPPKKAPGFYHR